MESSLFNVAVRNDAGEWILFNTLRSSLAVLDEAAYASYLSGDGEFLPELKQAGFIVDDAQDEIERQSAWFEADKNDRETLSLCVAPSYKCNLACTYCYELEQNIFGHMSEAVLEGIMSLVREIYERDRFKRLFITWYGGEPLLYLDTIEVLTSDFLQFCAANGIEYGAEIITNATLVDEEAATRLAACHVVQAMPTLAGCENLHDCRRIDKAGGGSFEATMDGIRHLRDAGLQVNASFSVDKKSVDDYRVLRNSLATEEGLALFPVVLQDYLGAQGADKPKGSGLDLYTREEYAHVAYELHKEGNYTKEMIAGLLQPIRNFCRGQLENYFVIDALGDVYKCDGRMGYKDHLLFNVLDEVEVQGLKTAHYNPMEDAECRECAILPLCKGQCTWDRALLEDGCHPFKYSLPAYLKDYRNFFGEAKESVTILVPPIDLRQFFAQPFKSDGLTTSSYSSGNA